jgi:hypothetical protein
MEFDYGHTWFLSLEKNINRFSQTKSRIGFMN